MTALKPGDPAPEFNLRTPFDVEVSLRPLLEEGPVVLEFIRGSWDPEARKRLDELDALEDRLKEYRARSIVVSCERQSTAGSYLEAVSIRLALVVDSERQVSRAYGVYQRFSFGAFRLARPATFLVDRCGFIRYAHVGRSPIDVAPVQAILRSLDELRDEAARVAAPEPPTD